MPPYGKMLTCEQSNLDEVLSRTKWNLKLKYLAEMQIHAEM